MRIAIPLLAAMLALSACQNEAKGPDTALETSTAASSTLSAVLTGADQYSTYASGLTSTGIEGVLATRANYTLLVPTNAAFGKLGDKGATLAAPEQRAVLAALLRDHILPGAVATEDIGRAIEANGGKPVKMRTLGEGSVTFSRDGTALIATGGDGSKATVGAATTAKNGVLLPLDGVLKSI